MGTKIRLAGALRARCLRWRSTRAQTEQSGAVTLPPIVVSATTVPTPAE